MLQSPPSGLLMLHACTPAVLASVSLMPFDAVRVCVSIAAPLLSEVRKAPVLFEGSIKCC